jgi:signal transduction histidine kinase
MKVTPALKKELAQWLEAYWTTYLKGDIETWATFLRDDYRNIGGTKEEIWNSKQEIIDYTNSIMNQMLGTVEIRNREVELIPYGEYMMVHEFTDIYVKAEGEWTLYGPFRMSSLLEKTDTGWIAIHQHGSYPDMKAMEGEAFSMDAVKAENAKLLEAVKSRTLQLEIEAALERVRAVAMGMKKPEDMLDVCRAISEQLQQFGVEKIRNVQTAIIDENIGQYLCYQYFTPYDKTTIEKTEYLKSSVEHGMVRQMLASRDGYFIGGLSGQELEDFRTHRKEENHFPDPFLDKATELDYCFLSIGEGGLGLTVYQPMAADVLTLFKRFHQVFSLAFQRFRDIQKAEAQAREAQIEAALEKVRSRSLAMHKSVELNEVVKVLFEKMIELRVPSTAVGIQTFTEGSKDMQVFVCGDVGTGLVVNHYLLPYFDHTIIRDYQNTHKEKPDYFVGNYPKKEKDSFYDVVLKLPELKDLPIEVKAMISQSEFYEVTMVPAEKSLLAVNDFKGNPLSESHINILKRFTKVFDQTYTRFLDLQKAEAQAREAQIEVAVERVRAQSMAMHHPDDLDKVNKEILTQLNSLQIQGLSGVTFYLVDQDGWVKAWDFSSPGNIGNQKSYTLQFDFKKYEMMGYPFKIFQQTDLNYLVADYPLEKLERAVYEIEEINPEVATVVKEALAKGILTHQWSACARISDGILGIDLVSPPSEDTKTIVLKIAGAFNQAYQRFLDLQKAEAQAREAQIEASLERTRTQSMLMQHSDEIKSISNIFHEQLLLLDIPSEFSYVWLPDEASQSHQFWASWSEKNEGGTTLQSKQVTYPLDKSEPYTAACFAAWANPEVILEEFIPPSDIAVFFEVWQELLAGATKLKADFFPQGIYYSEAYMRYGCFGINIRRKLSEEEKNILKRFSIEFERAYTRFLDLQKAEAQAREAQIEAALERVRSRSLAMHRSDELEQVAASLFEAIVGLGIAMDGALLFVFDREKRNITLWVTIVQLTNPVLIELPYEEEMKDNEIILDYWKATDQGQALSKVYTGEAKNEYFRYVQRHNSSKISVQTKNHLIDLPAWHLSFAAEKNTMLGLDSWSGHLFTESDLNTLRKFARAFEQAYVRFLDLQKAESQAREAQIQLALERVRARTMAMQSSEELAEVSYLLNKQVVELGIPTRGCAFNIYNEHDSTEWFSDLEGTLPPYPTPREYIFKKYYEAGQRGESLLVDEFSGDRIKELYQYFASRNNFENEAIDNHLAKAPEYQINYMAYFKYGYLLFVTLVPAPEAHDVFKRFAKEFEQTYTRFLDLQKAEAQAREAQIEAALERVRSRTMAMQKSEELADAAYVLFEQLNILGVTHERINIGIVDEANQQIDFWVTEQGGQKLQTKFSGRISEPTTLSKSYEAWKKGAKSLVVDLNGKELQSWLSYMEEEIKIPFNKAYLHTRRVQTAGFFSKGMLVVTSPEPLQEEAIYLLEKFAKVFDLTYTRFNDLLLAEAQAKEAQIELSLEKIRAQVASMQESTDLLDIMVNIRSEFVALGHEAHYFWYMRWLPEKYEKAMTSGDGTQVGMVMNLPRHMHGDIPLVANWELGEEPTLVFPMEVDMAVAYIDKMITLGDFIQIDPQAPTLDDIRHIGGLTFVMARTSQGEIGYSLPGYVPNPSLEAVGTLSRFAGVFDLAYKRFEDLKKAEKDLVEIKEAKKKAEEALVELKATQSQLVQQEKLASLGQLTAGIAHEIKNPLNFVNNFSEVSMEMIEEILEARSERRDLRQSSGTEKSGGKHDESEEMEEEILEDIKANLKKIHEHGTRANGIVTSMLQHSRGGSGKKEPTDLNALIKEYVNLSFHGMRAGKDPINVEIALDLDPDLGMVSLIQEDFTRVVINLCNNAFDAMREKVLKTQDARHKTQDGDSVHIRYDPKLRVTTMLENGRVWITFEDNGPGIPDEIKDKILQPFFTTKKGTEGTGLGLSITHDIVKAHGGELKVESTVGKGTEFTIKLPVNPS